MIVFYAMEVSPLSDAQTYSRMLSRVSAYRREKTERFRRPADRALSLGAGLLLDAGLRQWQTREADMTYGTGEHGKPFFDRMPRLRFSVSHSGDTVIAVLSDEGEVGCDIETLREMPRGVAERFFSEKECRAIEGAADPTDANRMFFRLWTLRESYIKMTGEGLALPMTSFFPTVENGCLTVIRNGVRQPCVFFEYGEIPFACVSLCLPENLRRPLLQKAEWIAGGADFRF